MSASAPPLAAMMTAHRNSDLGLGGRGDRRVVVGRAGAAARSPPGSREQIMFRASLRFLPPVSSQASDGPDDVGADQDEQGAGHQLQPRRRVACRGRAATGPGLPPTARRRRRRRWPATAAAMSGRAALPASPAAPAARAGDWRGSGIPAARPMPPPPASSTWARSWPVAAPGLRDGPGREPGPPVPLPRHGRRRLRRPATAARCDCDGRGHRGPVPNSTSSVSGR